MRFRGTNESDFIKLRSHENKTSSFVGERAEMDRYRASSADTSRRACAGHEAVEASPLSGRVEAGGRASTVCSCGSERRVASDTGILCGGESSAISGSMDWLDKRTTATTPGLILIRFQIETNYPWPSRERAHADRIGGEALQTVLQLPDHLIHMVHDAVGEELFTQFVPHMLLGVKFG